MNHTKVNPMEVVERQNAIIRIQSGVIDELFCLLMQHASSPISADEADSLPVIQKINTAASLRREVGEIS